MSNAQERLGWYKQRLVCSQCHYDHDVVGDTLLVTEQVLVHWDSGGPVDAIILSFGILSDQGFLVWDR